MHISTHGYRHTYIHIYLHSHMDRHTYIHMEVEEAITTISRNQQHASNTHTHTDTGTSGFMLENYYLHPYL